MTEPSAAGRPLLGILAGMGPDSTAPFLEMVVAECRARYGASRDEEFPPMTVLSWPTPFRPDRPADHEALRGSIGRGLELLATLDPAVIAMPCNTAHLYWSWLRERVEAPLLNMVTAAVAALPDDFERVALLATRATRDSGLYQRALEQRGMGTVAPESLQQAIDRALVALKRDPATGAEAWETVEIELATLDVDAILVACSDLGPVVGDLGRRGLAVVDSTRVLARELVSHWRSLTGPLDGG